MLLLVIDTETNGIEAENFPVEIGAILYDTETKTSLTEFSFLLPLLGGLKNSAESINGIPQAAIEAMIDLPMVTKAGTRMLLECLKAIEGNGAIVAHNAEFDSGVFFRSLETGLFSPFDLEQKAELTDRLKSSTWICSYGHIDWVPHPSSDLTKLALAHKVPVVSAHRALTDCRLLVEIMSKRDDMDIRLTEAMTPKATYWMNVGFHNRQLAKDAGFLWDSECKIGSKSGTWLRTMPEAVYKRKVANGDFDGLDIEKI